jgi:hypothetical protein
MTQLCVMGSFLNSMRASLADGLSQKSLACVVVCFFPSQL